MREGEGRDHKGACESGSCAFDGIDTAAGDDKSAGAEAEGEEFVCTFLREFKEVRRQYWGRHVWARGYFCVSSGNVTDEVIKEYIERHIDNMDEFTIEEREL